MVIVQMIRLGFVNARMPEKMRVALAVGESSSLTDSDSGSVECLACYLIAVSIRSFLRRNGWSKVTLPDTVGGPLITKWLPVLCPRACGDISYDLPDVGDQVLCVFLAYGLEQGFVVGSMYGKQVPPVQDADKWHRTFRDGTTLEYDRAAHQLTANIKGGASITSTGPLTLEAPIIYLRGTLVNTATDGAPGNAVISGGVEVLSGGISVPGGDVVAAGVSLVSHTTEGVMPGAGASSHPTGGSAESPGTGPVSQESLSEAEQLLAEGARLATLAENVAQNGSSTDRLLLCLPRIATAMAGKMSKERNKKGWNYLAAFFERWLAGVAGKDPLEGGEPAYVDWQWLEEFPRVRDGYLDIRKRLFNEAAEDQLLQRLVRDKKLKDERCTFNYIFPPTEVDGKTVPEWRQWKDDYFQSVSIEKLKIWDLLVNLDASVADGLMASMASFMIYALAKGYTEPAKEGGHNIVIQQVALVAWDSFNFNGTTDDYRFWRCEPPDFYSVWQQNYTRLTNEPFEKFRSAYGHGRDFLIISGPVNVELEEEHRYHVPC